MPFSTRTILRMAVLFLACAFTAMPVANTTTTFQFVGQCADCTGTGTGLLVLQNYTPGTTLTSSNFVSYTYSSNLINFSISSAQLTSISGSLPASLPGVANLSFNGSGVNGQFITNTQNGAYPGYWCAGAACSSDWGPTHTWSLYSAPVTPASGAPALTDTILLSLAAGIAVMGGMLLKRRAAGTI